ncbi:MAG TPA: hypothetical protein VMG58_00105, partial [Candidatus Sulfotelmatobacter sp.]|nr:hypothetical protein [Candidatus Sulfotelmatobacter sp.]
MDGDRQQFVLSREQFPELLVALRRRGYRLVGPTVREGAIAYGELNGVGDLPEGWTDEQEGGTYRLRRRNDAALFGYTVGPHSLKNYLHPPRVRLWQATRNGDGLNVTPEPNEPPPTAFIGVRACDLKAVAIQTRVFAGGPYVNIGYKTRLERSFIVAVNCEKAGGTCFCVSMGTGPEARSGFDLALTEVLEDGRHYFVGEAGSDRGAEVLGDLRTGPAGPQEVESARHVVARTAAQMGRSLDTTDIKELLYRNSEHP